MHLASPRVLLVAVVILLRSSLAAEFGATLPPTLAELETRAPKENTYPYIKPGFHDAVLRLIESNALSTGDEFRRAAHIACDPFHEYRGARIEYELLLAAIAQGSTAAESELPESWDALLRSIGRPMRINLQPIVAQPFDPERLAVDPTPAVIKSVYAHPAEARAAAARAASNPEIQETVTADQAPRKGDWSKLSEAERQAMGSADFQRATRIRLIVAAGQLHTATDFANASLVLQHSSSFAGYELAHELAVCALLLGDRGLGRWLVAATYDRMLNSVGHDQRFGTQGALMLPHETKPQLGRTDESGICDNERLALGCPTLAAKRADFYTAKPK